MKYTIVSSSPRSQSQSLKISRFIEQALKKLPGATSWLLDLSGNPLPLWDESIWQGAEPWQKTWEPIKSQLQSSDGFIFVVPEWSGMVPPGLKNLFLLSSAYEFGHKPALIVAISASRGGSYPVTELRLSSYKNTRLLYLPEHLILREVEKLFNPGTPEIEDDIYLRTRLDYCLQLLDQYAQALCKVRSSGVIDHKSFPNGM